MNRIDMLREMGITPVWVPRHAPAPVEKIEAAVAPKTMVDAPPGGISAESRSHSGLQGRAGVESASVRAPMANSAPAGVQPRTPPAGVAPAPASVDPQRAEAIARMDWPALKDAVASCKACGLCKSRHSTVFGTGDEAAELLIVGEAPGQEEDRQGEPFVGQAGQLLDAMLAALDLTRRKNVYIANTLKCRPPGNRNPEPGEMAQCAPHLIRQVELIAPKLILLMGRFAVQSILQTDASIASLRGKRHAWRGVPVVVTYHPAYLLRTLTDKAKAWEDLMFARDLMRDGAAG